MNQNHLPTTFGRLARAGLLFTTVLGFVAAVGAVPDNGVTQQVWKLKYGVSDAQLSNVGSWMDQDTDGDGCKNRDECAAGTNPFVGGSAIGITGIVSGGTSVNITFATQAGKHYVVQGTASLTAAFGATGVSWLGTGAPKTLTVPKGSNKFFRVMVQDYDTDGDGVGDWAEGVSSLNPNLAQTVPGVNDFSYVTGQIALPNIVTIKATEPNASEDGPRAGRFTIARTQKLVATTVTYSASGTAVPTSDYAALSGTVTFAPGADSATVSVTPVVDVIVEGSKSVTASLQASVGGGVAGYTLGAASSATVIISDSTVASGTGLLGRYYDTSSATYSNLANFDPAQLKLTRVDPTVNFSWLYGTPNDATIVPNSPVDNFSDAWEGYVSLGTAASVRFQLDADDKARVLLDIDRSGTFDLPGEEIVEHRWVAAGTVGTFKVSNSLPLAATPTSAERYRIRVEHVDASGDARCRLQWSLNGGTFANIPQGNIFNHTSAATYAFTRLNAATGTATVTLTNHGLAAGSLVDVAFSSGNLFTPNAADAAGYSGTFSVLNPTANTFQVAITGTNLPANVAAGAACFVENRPASTSTGWMTRMFTNTTFTGAPGFVGIQATGPTTTNNGIWGMGAPDPSMGKDAFSVRWSGQVQPQYSETYTFAVTADDGCALKIGGQSVPLRLASSSTQTGTYSYDGVTGNVVFNYTNTVIQPGAFTAGEKVRLDPTSGNLIFPSATCTYSYDGTTGDTLINYNALVNAPVGKFAVGETVYLDPTSGNLTSLASLPYLVTAVGTGKSFTVNFGTGAFATGAGNVVISDTYNYNSATGIAVIDYSNLPNLTATGFSVGETVLLDPTTGSLSALTSLPYVITATGPGKMFTVNLGQNLGASGAGAVSISDNRDLPITAATPSTFTVNFGVGKVATGTGSMTVDALNKEIKDWTVTASERYARLPVVGGARYDIQLDYFEGTGTAGCVLSWYSPSQTRQVIPASRLYPASAPQAPTAHISTTESAALVGGPFSYQILGSNGGTISVSGSPSWLTLSGNVLSGTPTPGSGGDFQVIITITNGAGTSTSVLNLRVDDTVGSVVREHWSAMGTTVASIPVGTPATGTSSLTSLAGPTDFGENYGARIRGYITAPVTGNYYFWIAANNSAELWVSNDKESVNAFKRAWVNAGSETPQTWNAEPNQKSAWLALEQGKKYYFEVLHKAGVGAGDNLAVGWLKPGQTGDVPSEVVPGYALSPYVPPAPGSTPGTLYVATMLSQAGAETNGVGTATLRLNEDETVAYIRWTSNGLTGAVTDWHIHSDPFLSHPSAIIYDGAEPLAGDGPQPDGSHKWNIIPSGTLSLAEVRELIKQGRAYLNLHTAAYPNGEIRGNFALAEGSRTFTPPPAPPAWADDSNTNNGAVRFLTQATFGGSAADVQALRAIVPPGGKTRYEAWIDAEFAKTASHQLPEVIAYELTNVNGQFGDSLTYNAWWKNSMAGNDQLRQRVAFALSQIHVVSTAGPLQNNARAVSYFYDKLADNAFGNFRDILEDTTLTPSMGRYLDMLRNDKPDQTIGRIPNENYAREIKQLFSIGLFRMWPDGSLVLNSEDEVVPTYTQNEIVGLAHVFTGWDYGYDGALRTTFTAATTWTRQMREVPGRHYVGQKRILDNEVLPGLSQIDPYAPQSAVHFNDPAYLALPREELDAVHDQLFNHPNTGPFICRQLIQRMVTSHPTRDYLYRVVQKFNNNGSGVRGDMQAVIKAILLDFEARSTIESVKSDYGKQREPVMRIGQAARAFRPAVVTGTYSQVSTGTASRTITVNTAAPHRLNSANSVFLEFSSGSPVPYSGIYSVAAISGSQNTSTSFTVNATGWAAGTYSQATGTSAITITIGGHWLAAGHKCYLDFQTGGANGVVGLDNAIHTVTTSAGETSSTFTITDPAGAAASARSGNVIMPRFTPGSYQVSTSGMAAPNDRRVRLNVNHSHHLNVGDPIFLNFSGPNGAVPTDGQFAVESVVDNTTFTVLGASTSGLTTNLNDNGIWMFPLLPQPRDRSGSVSTRSSTFSLGSTNADIAQTPLNSPTVFNYFLPDFKFPGALASQAITTPEFQLTSDTNVVRQSNFIFNGVFNPTNTNGISSFRSGSNALVMDFGPWMGNAVDISGLGAGPQPTQAWTSNLNLPTLIDRMNTLLLAGQLPASGKTVIQNFVLNTTNVPYNNTTPADSEKRDRIRSIIHLIITSADYTIQR